MLVVELDVPWLSFGVEALQGPCDKDHFVTLVGGAILVVALGLFVLRTVESASLFLPGSEAFVA